MKKKFKISFNSPVVLGFVAVSFLTMILNYLTSGKSNQLLFMTYHSSLRSPLTYLRFFTQVLGHAGWEHFIGNIMYLLLLGPLLEEKYGSLKVLEIITVTGLITGIFNYIFFLERCIVRSQWSRIRFYPAFLLDKLQRKRDTDYFYIGHIHFSWTAGM